MSQEKDKIGEENSEGCCIDTNLLTRATTKMHRLRWTIENVSQLPLNTKVISPDFDLTKACVCSIAFEKCLCYSFVYLRNKSDGDIKIQRSIVFSDCEGTALYDYKMETTYTIKKDEDVSIVCGLQRNIYDSLKDDILIIDFSLKVEGSITTKKSFYKSGRETREKLMKDLKTMFNNPVDSDFTLEVGNEIIHSHKNLLRARSAYFKRMFETDMKESAENSVSISDVSYPSMKILVEFLYTGDFAETLDNNNIQQISDLYFAADKYEVLDLRASCANKLMSTATADSICQILQLAHRHNDDNLKVRAMNFISSFFDKIEKTIAWKTLISSEIALASEVLSFCFRQFKSIP